MKYKRELKRSQRRSRKAQRGWSCYWRWPIGHVWAGDATPTSMFEHCLYPGCIGERLVGM